MIRKQSWWFLRSKLEDLAEDERWHIDEWFRQFNLQTNPYKVHFEFDFYSHHDITLNGLI